MAITMSVGLPATLKTPGAESSSAIGSPATVNTLATAALPERKASEESAQRLAELLRLHYARVWRTLRQIGVAEAHADDAAQEVFIVLSRRLDELPEGTERKFLLSSAVRVAANYRRSWRVRHEVADEHAVAAEQDPRPAADQLLDQKRLRQALDDLLEGWPDEIRTAFVLFELEGLSVPEISELTDTKIGTVSSRLRRARELFQAGVKRLRARGAAGGAA
ncbi:MAG TPA: sigma-70 family RNA polymerase sigma factor [Polyangiaceae bacterium]|nr:sigma-70 family RNA polymerase sigma factor [Polyangiaceae bacterium]